VQALLLGEEHKLKVTENMLKKRDRKIKNCVLDTMSNREVTSMTLCSINGEKK
jgi:hypothetical protein